MHAAAVSSISGGELFLLSWLRLQVCDTHSSVCNLQRWAVPACLLRPPINASMLHLFFSHCSCCSCKIVSSISETEERQEIWSEIFFRDTYVVFTPGRYFSMIHISLLNTRSLVADWYPHHGKDYTKEDNDKAPFEGFKLICKLWRKVSEWTLIQQHLNITSLF